MSDLSELFEGIETRIRDSNPLKGKTLSTRQVVEGNYTTSDFEKLVTAMQQRPLDGIETFRLSSFIEERQENRIPAELRRRAADNIADLVQSTQERILPDAIMIFAMWGKEHSDYYIKCLSILQHPEEGSRWTALRFSPVFLRPADYGKLIQFRRDRAVTEIAMGGPLRFHLRDLALEILEKLTKSPKSNNDCFEKTVNGNVSYRSWTVFLNWFEKNEKSYR